MARPQAPDYAQRRAAIVDTAVRLFASKGFAETAVSEIAQSSGISKSLLYHYFPSKEDVLYAVMASHIDLLSDDVDAVMAMAGAPVDKLSALIHRFMDHYVGAGDRQKVLLNELGALPAERRATIVGKQRRIVDAARELVTAVDPAGNADPVRARARTMLVFGMINWTHTWFDPAGALGAGEIADMVIELALPKTGGGAPQAS